MRYKVVPSVRSISFLRGASACLPLVPDTVEDCCTRIRDGTDLQSRDAAREYLTFLQALGLADETEGGYYRPRDPPDDDALSAAFLEGIYGARECLDALDAGPKTVEGVFEEGIEPIVPRWERNRDREWRETWRERTERLLEWGVVFGHVERVDGEQYRRIE